MLQSSCTHLSELLYPPLQCDVVLLQLGTDAPRLLTHLLQGLGRSWGPWRHASPCSWCHSKSRSHAGSHVGSHEGHMPGDMKVTWWVTWMSHRGHMVGHMRTGYSRSYGWNHTDMGIGKTIITSRCSYMYYRMVKLIHLLHLTQSLNCVCIE